MIRMNMQFTVSRSVICKCPRVRWVSHYMLRVDDPRLCHRSLNIRVQLITQINKGWMSWSSYKLKSFFSSCQQQVLSHGPCQQPLLTLGFRQQRLVYFGPSQQQLLGFRTLSATIVGSRTLSSTATDSRTLSAASIESLTLSAAAVESGPCLQQLPSLWPHQQQLLHLGPVFNGWVSDPVSNSCWI